MFYIEDLMSLSRRGAIELAHNSNKYHSVEAHVGETPITFEVGRIAKQAQGSVVVRWGDTLVLVTACAAREAKSSAEFFPLTCEYVEKSYAAGRIPGGFFKRETKPRESEILNARIIDRSIRPLFPEGFFNEVQVIATVMSHDGEHDSDAISLCAASMALHVSDIPFGDKSGPIAGVRVGRIDGKLIANPRLSQLAKSDIDMIVAVSKEAIVMVEGGAKEVSESDLIDALFFAHQEGQKIIQAIEDMRVAMGKEKFSYQAHVRNEELFAQVREKAIEFGLKQALKTREKQERYSKIDDAEARTIEALKANLDEAVFAENQKNIANYFEDVKSELMRMDVLDTKSRIDGRAFDEIRNICSEVGILPRAHGSSLFTRGETQAIVSITLGTRDDEQRIDGLQGETTRRFMLHYNFPPFSVGEVKMLRGSSRREIGHGALAERAVQMMAPMEEKFPYTIRVVSEITESNGSSSMASVCGATLALWDAGVAIQGPVAGIAMGLIKEGDRVAVLSDILGDEDHLGDMDFKVCGTKNGVTAIQMDIKIAGLDRAILTKALDQARAGRLHILGEMFKAIDAPRAQLSEFAPRITSMRINPDKIRDVIGPGGRMIRDIVARTGAKVDITDDGMVQISGVGNESVAKAMKIIEDLTRESEVNRVYKGIVRRLMDFGAFVEIFPGTEGLCHVSELAENRVNNVADVLQEGDEVLVAVLSIDRDGKIRLSRKRALGKAAGDFI